MRILSLYYTHKPGGFCKRLYRALAALAQRNHEVHYLSLDPPPPEFPSSVFFRRIPFCMGTRDGAFFWLLFTLWCPIYAAFVARKLKADRYFVFGAYYAAMMCVAKKFCAAPLVLFMRSLVFKINRITEKPLFFRLGFDLLERFGARSADTVVCMTESMRNELEKFIGGKLRKSVILPNDLPPARRVSDSASALKRILNGRVRDETLLILTSGVIDQRKNLDLLFDAFNALGERDNGSIFLIIAGDGPLFHTYRPKAPKQVEFLGWCDTLEPLYAEVDLIIHPSLHEGMPNSVLEALAHGKPVLLADTPEHRELLPVEEALFPLNDAAKLAERLLTLARDPQALADLSSICQKHSEKYRFDWHSRVLELLV